MDKIVEWLTTEHFGIRGIWIAMFSLGVFFVILSLLMK